MGRSDLNSQFLIHFFSFPFFQSLDDPYSRGRMFHDRLGDFGGSYDPALGDPRGGHGVEFGGRGGPRTEGGAGAVFGPDPLLEDERRYYSSDSVPMHSESYPRHHPPQSLPPSMPPPQPPQPPPPPLRGATAAGGGGGVTYDDGGVGGYAGGGGGMAAGGMGGMGRRAPRGGHEFGGESDMESVVSATSAFSSHSAPHARGRRMMHPGAMQQG